MAADHSTSIGTPPTSFQASSMSGPSVRSQAQSDAPQQPKIPAMTQEGLISDPYYGHENTALLCARFVTHLFAHNGWRSTPSCSNSKLQCFIAHVLYRTKLHSSVTFAALVLLQHLKAHFPTARGSSCQRLFLTSFMITSKVISDNKHSNKTWSIIGQGVFELWDINNMELEMCQYLDWELNFEPRFLKEFEDMVRKTFAGPGPYPAYVIPTISKPASSTTNHFPIATLNKTFSPIPSFDPRLSSPPKPTLPPSQVHHQNPQSMYTSPPPTPDTPSPCRSDSTSPASPASPPTPNGVISDSAVIVELSNSLHWSIRQFQESCIEAVLLKQKTFAFVAPSAW